MYFKLALRNVKKSFRDYSIYFLTLMFGVCIFYVFNSIEEQLSMMKLTESQYQAIRILSRILDVASVFVSVILGFLIVYANRFLFKRRKKELGIYQILGMEKGHVSRILITETMLVAFLSLVCGLFVGVFISHGFALVTASLFEVKLAEFKFIFSAVAAKKAIIYFGIAFIFVMVLSNIEFGREKLINLLYADRKNEKFKTPHLILSVVIFIVSVLCLTTAYIMIIENGLLEINIKFWNSIILGVVGTFLFFFSLSGFFLKVIQQTKSVYFKGLNMFVLKQINSKINTTYVSLTMVCLMLFLAICALSSGMGISKSITSDMERYNPYDSTFFMSIMEDNYDQQTGEYIDSRTLDVNIMDELDRTDNPVDSYAKQTVEIRFYYSDIDLHLEDGSYNSDYMKLSEYNNLLQMQGKQLVSMEDNEFILNCIDDKLTEQCIDYFKENKVIIGGNELVMKGSDDTVLFNGISKGSFGITFILPDELLMQNDARTNMLAVNYIRSTHEYDELFYEATQQMLENVRNRGVGSSTHLSRKLYNFEQSKSTAVTVAYLAVYLGIVFLIISAVVLAISQLSETSDNITRYELLRKLGTDGIMIKKALFSQIAVYFIVPLLLALVHSVVGIKVASSIVLLIGERNILRDSIFAAVVIVVIYGGYFLATYLGSRRIVNKG